MAKDSHYWEKWEYGKWRQDVAVRMCTPLTRGIWFEAINCMMEARTYKLTGSADQLAAACCCDAATMCSVVAELKALDVCDVHKQNGIITLINRKRYRDFEISELRRAAGRSGGSKSQANRKQEVKQTSNYNSISVSVPEGGGPGEPKPAWSTPQDAELPTLAEFQKHAAGVAITPEDVQKCYNHYAAVGFMRGSTRITNFRALMATWAARSREMAMPAKIAGPNI